MTKLENKEQKIPQEKNTPFLKRIAELEKKVDKLETKLNAIAKSLKSRG